MRISLLLPFAATLAVAAPAAAAQFIVTTGSTAVPIASNNDFRPQLLAVPLASITDTGASISLSGPARVRFEFLASESGFSDSFRVGGTTLYSEAVSGTINNWMTPVALGSRDYAAGGSVADWFFDSVQGMTNQGIGKLSFGIFLPGSPKAGDKFASNVLYLGFDDQPNNADDNHDDFIIRVTAGAIPEPATWAMMIAGFGLVGFAARRRRTLVAA